MTKNPITYIIVFTHIMTIPLFNFLHFYSSLCFVFNQEWLDLSVVVVLDSPEYKVKYFLDNNYYKSAPLNRKGNEFISDVGGWSLYILIYSCDECVCVYVGVLFRFLCVGVFASHVCA
jgi:hypothetical protein